jgi:1,5-anhydro-D-fructose reductase (1,5-anhydro-D-mannitol-forming)
MIRIGIVGCGRILNAHLQAFKTLKEFGINNFEITGLCELKAEDALMFLERGKGPPPRAPVLRLSKDPLAAPPTYLSDFQRVNHVGIYTNYHELIANSNVDAVMDLTTVAEHHLVGEASLRANKPLLTQKPLAISVRAARHLVDLANERHLTFGVFENLRQEPLNRAIAWAVRRGLIGEPQLAIVGSFGGLWSPDKVVADTPWRHKKLLGGGGSTIDIGVHLMHMLRYIIGPIYKIGATVCIFEPVRYQRDEQNQIVKKIMVDADDTFIATIFFERGAIGQAWWSWGVHGRPVEIPGMPAVLGSKGSIRGDELLGDGRCQLELLKEFDSLLSPDEREQFFPLGLRNPYAIQQLDWLRAIERGSQPETSGLEGLYDLACGFAMIESSNLGQQIPLEEVLNSTVDNCQREIDQYYSLI